VGCGSSWALRAWSVRRRSAGREGGGLRTGLLAATEQGANLYRRLGWTIHGEIGDAIR
jgi:hypothetical protein